MDRATRLKKIEHILLEHPKGLRAVEIAEGCGVDRRTIYRDLLSMQEMGLPIWQEQGRFGIRRDNYFAELQLSFNEALVLMCALRLLGRYQEMPALTSLTRKIAGVFPALPTLPRDNSLLACPPDVLETLALAWIDGYKVRIIYKRQGRSAARVIAPYLLDISPQGDLYAIAHDEVSEEIVVLPLHRVLHVARLEARFEVPANFDPARYLVRENLEAV